MAREATTVTNNIRNARALVLDLIQRKQRDLRDGLRRDEQALRTHIHRENKVFSLERQLQAARAKAETQLKKEMRKAAREWRAADDRLDELRKTVLFASIKELKAIYDKETKR